MSHEWSGGPARGPGAERHLADLVGLDRFGAFSDGVYAIAITRTRLLAHTRRVPPVRSRPPSDVDRLG